MAKDDGGKVRFAFIEIEGSSQMIQEVIKTAATALRPAVVRIPAPAVLAGHTPPSSGDGQLLLPDPDSVEEPEIEAPARSNAPKAKKARTYSRPKVVAVDLDGGSMSLRTFCEKKGPSNQLERYLVVAAWFHQYQSLETICKDHIWTSFNAMPGWGIPRDLDSTFRSGKKDALFVSGAERGSFTITHVGLSRVREMGSE